MHVFFEPFASILTMKVLCFSFDYNALYRARAAGPFEKKFVPRMTRPVFSPKITVSFTTVGQ